MRGQWGLIIGLIVALLVTIFAVINVDIVTVNYVFGTAQLPLVIIIISSVLAGALLVGAVGLYQFYKLRVQLKKLRRENEELQRKSTLPDQPLETETVSNDEVDPKI